MEKTKMTYVNAIDTVLTGAEMTDEVREKLEALKATLIKRNAKTGTRKPTKTQKENAEVKIAIAQVLTAEGQKCGDIAEAVGISGQKCSALLSQMVADCQASKYTEKRVTYFTKFVG